MPLKLTVGLTRKLGLPGYSSAGAGCHVELEFDQDLLRADPDAFQAAARAAYAACRRAVDDQLARYQPSSAPRVPVHGHQTGAGDGTPAARAGGHRPDKPATPGQVWSLRALARRRGADLGAILQDDYGVGRPEDLSVPQASRLIGSFKAAAGS
jgi:hypothetical protein